MARRRWTICWAWRRSKVNEDRLYRGLDALLPHKDGLFRHFQQVYGELFGTTYDLLLYDITSTYFEGQGEDNPQARRGYSRDSRPDCVQVCIALVVTPEGLPLAYEVFDGNRADVTTVEEIVEVMREKYGQERRTWVMDRGMVSEDNLDDAARGRGVVSGGHAQVDAEAVRARAARGDATGRRSSRAWRSSSARRRRARARRSCLCRSPLRKEKEKAMRSRQVEKLEQALAKLQARRERPTSGRCATWAGPSGAWGGCCARYSRAAHLFEVEISEAADPAADRQESGSRSRCARKAELEEWAAQADGCYLLRTNLEGKSAAELWKTYIGLTQIEDCFRIAKHDLGLRPVFHHTAGAHAGPYSGLLSGAGPVAHAAAMDGGAAAWGRPRANCSKRWPRCARWTWSCRRGRARELRLRTVSRPEPHLAILLQRLGLLAAEPPQTNSKCSGENRREKRKIPTNGGLYPLNCAKMG